MMTKKNMNEFLLKEVESDWASLFLFWKIYKDEPNEENRKSLARVHAEFGKSHYIAKTLIGSYYYTKCNVFKGIDDYKELLKVIG